MGKIHVAPSSSSRSRQISPTINLPLFFSFLSIQHHVMLHKSNLSTQLSTNQRRGTDIRYVRNEAPHTCDQFTTICYRGEWLITQLGPCSRSAPHVSVAMISTISCNDPPISYCVSGYTSWFHVIVIISRLIVDWWTLLWSEFYCMVHICPNYVLCLMCYRAEKFVTTTIYSAQAQKLNAYHCFIASSLYRT